MTQYGQTHRILDFIEGTIPRRGEGQFASLFAHSVIVVLKRLDAIQRMNFRLTLSFQTGSEIRVFYQGQLAFTLKPAQQHIRLIVGREWQSPAVKQIVEAIAKCNKAEGQFGDTKHGLTHYQWRLDADELNILCNIIEHLKTDNPSTRLSATHHPRRFPGDVRQAALEAFAAGGSWCPGVVGRRKHKVDIKGGDKLEFDHILPHAKGGSNSALNIQVLCAECNNAKSSKAI